MTEIRIAPHRNAARSGHPFVWFDDSDPSDPGWVLRYWDAAGEQNDNPLDADNPDDEAAALNEARTVFERRFGQ
jgi:hypothetical protein